MCNALMAASHNRDTTALHWAGAAAGGRETLFNIFTTSLTKYVIPVCRHGRREIIAFIHSLHSFYKLRNGYPLEIVLFTVLYHYSQSSCSV